MGHYASFRLSSWLSATGWRVKHRTGRSALHLRNLRRVTDSGAPNVVLASSGETGRITHSSYFDMFGRSWKVAWQQRFTELP